MTTKELKSLLATEENITITLEGEWKLNQNNNLGYKSRMVWNDWIPEKTEYFETETELVKFFMSKVSYLKRVFKQKNITSRGLNIEVTKK